MERGNPSSHSGQPAKSGSDGVEAERKGKNDNKSGGNGVMRDKNQTVPITKVMKIMRDVIPENARISEEAKDTIQECVSEYINLITGEANEHCFSEHRKTVTAEDLIFALNNLGFEDYVHPLTLFLDRFRRFEGDSSQIRK